MPGRGAVVFGDDQRSGVEVQVDVPEREAARATSESWSVARPSVVSSCPSCERRDARIGSAVEGARKPV
jgi:hypothetical protein